MSNIFDIKGKTVLISGASRGIGRGFAEGFRNAGAIVYGTGSRPESVEWMQGTEIQGRAANVREPGAMGAIIQEIADKHGQLDILINNAAVAANLPASQFKEDTMEEMIDTNFKGVFRTCQSYHKIHKKRGGNIINISSILGMITTPLASVYCGTKGAVIQLTKALAVEWAGSNFRVNTICPGFVDTDMTVMIKKKPEVLEKMEAGIPLKRLAQPEDMLGAALFLASDASSYMTGQSIVIDGGASII